MPAAVSRRSFLRGKFLPSCIALRPPWSCEETLFLERCTRCNDCLEACETGILVRGHGGYPEVRFENGECTFCGDCASACQTAALAHTHAVPWTLAPAIGTSCLAQQGIVCQVCGDQCDARAIRFPPRLGAVAIPVPDFTACNGCGACVAPCPSQAITLTEVP